MEIKVNSDELSKRLEQLARVADSRNAIPILADVMIETKGNVMILTSSDSELWLSVKCPIFDSSNNMKFCVNAKDFLGLVKNINDKEITISLDENTHTVNCDYGNGNFSMPYDNAEEFPQSNVSNDDNMSNVILDGKKILRSINLTEFAVGNSTIRPIMNGVHFDFHYFGENCGMAVSATDGFKIAFLREREVSPVSGEVKEFTLPRKPYNVLSSILNAIEGDVKISFNTNSISVNNSDFKMTARLIEGVFPKCEQVFPPTWQANATIDKGSLLQALKRVTPMSNDMSDLVVLYFEQGQITITADNVEFGKSASETVKCDCDSEINVGFKGSSLIEALRNIDDDNIVIEIAERPQCGVFYAASAPKEEYVSLLMQSLIK